MSEPEIIKRAKEGDMEAFSQLVTLYENKILNYCFRMLNNRGDAEDATQEVFIKVYRYLNSYLEQSAFSTWLYKIASNVCLDYLRKVKRNRDTVSINQQNAEGEEFSLMIEDKGLSPYDNAQLGEARKALSAAISSLGEEQRQVIILREIEGLSYEEIAEITRLAPGTVKSRINRARQALKKILEKDRELFSL